MTSHELDPKDIDPISAANRTDRNAHSALHVAASSVARDHAPELIAAAKTLAAAANDEISFLRLWIGIGELARSGILDPRDAAQEECAPVLSRTRPLQKENNHHD